VERPSKRHRMDGQETVVGELKDDDLEDVAGAVWPDHEHLRRIAVRIDVDDDNWVFDGVEDIDVINAVTPR